MLPKASPSIGLKEALINPSNAERKIHKPTGKTNDEGNGPRPWRIAQRIWAVPFRAS